MHGKHAAMSHAFPDLMLANLLRIFNERNRRRRAAAIRAIYTKDCLPMQLNPCVVGMECMARWTAYTLRIPVSFFSRAGRPSHIMAWHVSDGGSGHRTPAMTSLASMSPFLKRASSKPYMSSLTAVPVQASRADGRSAA